MSQILEENTKYLVERYYILECLREILFFYENQLKNNGIIILATRQHKIFYEPTDRIMNKLTHFTDIRKNSLIELIICYNNKYIYQNIFCIIYHICTENPPNFIISIECGIPNFYIATAVHIMHACTTN